MKRVINPKEGARIENFSFNGVLVFDTDFFEIDTDIIVSNDAAQYLQKIYGFLEVEDLSEEETESLENETDDEDGLEKEEEIVNEQMSQEETEEKVIEEKKEKKK